MGNEDFELVIEPGKIEKNYWLDIWRFRELFYILAWRDIKVRYKQTVIGAAWSVIRPFLTMVVFTIVFSKVAKLPADGNAPYAIMVFAAMLPWQFFSNSLSEASSSLISNTNLITKVYFPRLIIPASSVITSFVDFAISFGIMVAMMIYYRYIPTWHVVFLPAFLLLALFASFGISLYFTALNVKYRDFRYIIPFVVQFGVYVSPVGFSSKLVPAKWIYWYDLNPMVGVIDGFRWCLLSGDTFNTTSLLFSVCVTILFTIIGVKYFRSTERSFADNI
jgi:lipopolysaccharide transport system permease protein